MKAGELQHFWIYSSYEWDKELKKFVGSIPVGYGQSYQGETRFSQTIIYDLEGTIKSYEQKGKNHKPLED